MRNILRDGGEKESMNNSNYSTEALNQATAKARLRLLPFLVLMYVLAFIDRSNVGFAKNMLQADTGISDAAFAFGAGIFFIGYVLCGVPSNFGVPLMKANRSPLVNDSGMAWPLKSTSFGL